MAGLKPLKPSLKEKKRYIIFQVHSEKDIPSKDVLQAIDRACLEFMGILYYGKAGVMILKNQYKDNQGIIRVSHKYVDHVKASLLFIKQINNIKIKVEPIGVSGILKKGREKFMAE